MIKWTKPTQHVADVPLLRLVGINATQVYTMVYKKKVAELGDDDLVSVGRIQTPILRLIVDRANAIKDFKKVIRAPSQ